MSPTPSAQFDYVRGNPDNLVGAADADMGDIQGPFYDIRDWLNSQILDLIAQGGLLIGEVRFVAVAARPTMWLACDGQSKDRALYPQLFSAISTTYGPGTVPGSTFNVPDLRGRVMAGTGASDGTGTNHGAGAKFGNEVMTFGQMPNHVHAVDGTAGLNPADLIAGGGAVGYAGLTAGVDATLYRGGISVRGAGGDQAHWQPSLAVPAWIYAGVEP